MNCESVQHTVDGYCKLRVKDTHNSPPGILTKRGFICPKAFINHFKQIIDQAKIDISRIGTRYSIRKCECYDK